jgi:SAM-dependent methyltransferase
MSNPDTLPLSPIHRLPPALLALIAHLPGLALVGLLLGTGLLPAGLLAALLSGLAAAIMARQLALPNWWRVINLLFVPAVWLLSQVELDPAWYLAGFLLLALTSLGAVRTRVPLYLSSPRAAEELARRLPAHGHCIDLGCGLGGPLARIARLRPDVRLSGVEAAPLNWLIARLRLRGRADIRLGSLWEMPLGDADLVYAYLSPAPMAQLWSKAQAEMKPGSLLVSNSFEIPGVPARETLELGDRSQARLLLWRMP